MAADECPQKGTDTARALEPGGAGGRVLGRLGDVGALGIVLEVAVEADREDVPGCPLVAHEYQILRPAKRLQVGVLHLPLAGELGALAGERLKHLDVTEGDPGGPDLEHGERRTDDEDILLPGDRVPDLREDGLDGSERFLAPRDAFGSVIVRIPSDREDQEEVPAVSLAVAHPEGRLIRALPEPRAKRLVELDELEEPAGGGLDEARLVEEAGRTRRRSGRGHTQRQSQQYQTHGTLAGSLSGFSRIVLAGDLAVPRRETFGRRDRLRLRKESPPMNINALKAMPMALLLIASSVASPAVGDEPSEKKLKSIVITDDGVFSDGDEPFVWRFPEHGRQGRIGVRLLDMTPELRAHYGAPREAGVLVAGVEEESPASQGRIPGGVLITRAGQERIESAADLSRAVRRAKAGDTLKLEISRDRASKQLTVKVEERRISEIDLGDLGRDLGRDIGREIGRHAWVFRDRPVTRDRHVIRDLPEFRDRLQERIDELEKRLHDLEKKLPAR